MVQKFFSFDSMITPLIIKIIFWVGVVFSILSGLGIMISGFNSYYGGGFQVFMGILTIVVGPLIVRIYCELLIIAFKIHDSLKVIKEKLTENTNKDIL